MAFYCNKCVACVITGISSVLLGQSTGKQVDKTCYHLWFYEAATNQPWEEKLTEIIPAYLGLSEYYKIYKQKKNVYTKIQTKCL